MAAITLALGSPAMPVADATPLIRGSVTSSTTALSAAPQVHATENGKCTRSGPNC